MAEVFGEIATLALTIPQANEPITTDRTDHPPPALNMARKSNSMAANNKTAASPHLDIRPQRDPIELLYEGVMGQPQVRKHQVCDHCGGGFGMVTHRWWGRKFCKRTCKDAYLREVTLDRDTIRRWFGLRVCRAAQAVGGTPLWVQLMTSSR